MIQWFASPDSGSLRITCPNCASSIARRPVLAAGRPDGGEATLLACPACGAHFFEASAVGDYGAEPPGGGPALAFYLQQGAGLGGIAARLASLGRPAGTRYLEIGCGFGLGLDIARRSLGWEVLGLDPSPFAAAGREQLGLPIEQRYLTGDDAALGSFDVVHASEFLEHVPDPLAILRVLRAALRPGGTLLLTTPAAEMIRPDTPQGLLVPLLSAGWHMVIQTAASLDMLLRRAGFEEVRVIREDAQLVARCGPLPAAVPDGAILYRRWLEAARDAVPATSDLGIGLAARLFRECSVAGDEAAQPAWAALGAACLARYGRSPEMFGDGPEVSLVGLVEREPLCLGGVLLHRGLEVERKGAPAEALFADALAASRRLRSALREIGSDDGDAEDVGFAAEAASIRLAARRGEAGLAERCDALEAAGGRRHAEAARRQAFVALVNAGALDAARPLAGIAEPALAALRRAEILSHEEASVLFCGAALELQTSEGRHAEAVEWLRALRFGLLHGFAAGRPEAAAVLLWHAVDAEALGLRLLGRDEEAAALPGHVAAETSHLPNLPRRPAA